MAKRFAGQVAVVTGGANGIGGRAVSAFRESVRAAVADRDADALHRAGTTGSSGTAVVRVLEGGEVTDRVPTPQPTFACMLGGTDAKTLFVLTAPGSHPDEVAGKAAGAIWTMPVEVGHAGLP